LPNAARAAAASGAAEPPRANPGHMEFQHILVPEAGRRIRLAGEFIRHLGE
jgi:hypothetical protein